MISVNKFLMSERIEAISYVPQGEMQMIMPTIKNLQSCSEFTVAKDMLDSQKRLKNEDIPPMLPKFFKENGNWVGLLPGDDGYEDH